MEAEELNGIIEMHEKWLKEEEGGKRADLSGADLSGAIGLPLSCAIPDIDATILSHIEGPKADGALDMYTWHSCETTHCRAGWAVTIAPGGKVLEEVYGTGAAAAIIYAASGQPRIPDWQASNEEALADLRVRAVQKSGDSS